MKKEAAHCLPSCHCTSKLSATEVPEAGGGELTTQRGWSGSRGHVPVKIPDEVERRAGIVVTLRAGAEV